MDRTTREVKIKAQPNRKAPLVAQACIELLKDEQIEQGLSQKKLSFMGAWH